MAAIPVIAIFDIGKTNKKLFLIDETYQIVWERTARFSETVDEDGFPCENLDDLRLFVFESLREVSSMQGYHIKAINFSTYGASFVYLNGKGETIACLYNYLKPFPEAVKKQFYETYGGESVFSRETASPVLGSLNSGMQLYRIEKERPELFQDIRKALHLPQYMSYLLTGKYLSDLTSIGCHTALWDFTKWAYHTWVEREGILPKLAPIMPSDHVEPSNLSSGHFSIGIGLHDSSAALIPYLVSFHEPFVLLSTGTWCISLNPFNHAPLTSGELENDCLCYITFEGKPVKASRLFAGKEHEEQTARIADHFGMNSGFYKAVAFDESQIAGLQLKHKMEIKPSETTVVKQSVFAWRNLDIYSSAEEAYHQLMLDIIREQQRSTQLVVNGSPVNRIFVDGGFSNNSVYMNLLAAAFPSLEVFAASVAQATAVGAALAIHHHWNSKALLNHIIDLKFYSQNRELII